MHRDDFKDPSTGTLVPTINREWAFVPAPLPPVLDMASIALPMAQAMQAIGELRGASRRLQNPYILIRPLQRREALTSSAMEGTFTTTDHLILAEAGVETERDESTQEVINYLDALNECLELLHELPISHRVVKRAHERLLSGLSASRGASKRPGQYKKEQNWIGGYTIDKARFIPPPPQQALECMNRLESYINRPDPSQAPIIDLALVHYQLETIHPFADGNGRVGRMLISLMAVHNGLLNTPTLYMSPSLERHKDEYMDLMFNVSTKGDWHSWLNFFFERIHESCTETVETIDRLIDLQQEYRRKATDAMRSASALTVIDMLFERPAITVRDAQDKLGVTYRAAKLTIDRLIQIGMLRQFANTYPMVFYAPEVLNVSRPPSQQLDGQQSGSP